MYLQLDTEGRVVGLSEESDELFPHVYEGQIPDDFDNYILQNGELIRNERESNRVVREENERLSTREEMLETLPGVLADTDDVIIELYETTLRQEEIIARQDDAIIELYEMIMEG